MERYSALAAMNLEANPDKQMYIEQNGSTMEIAKKRAEEISVTGEAYRCCLKRFQHGEWQEVEHFDCYN